MDISIIIPAHNSEKTLEKCLDSVLNQKEENIEVIVVNNGSTDNTLELLKKYKDVIVLDYKKSGIGFARNEGIKIAKGKYLYFLDSDDYLEKDSIKKLKDYVKINDVDLVDTYYLSKYDNHEEVTKGYEFNITNISDDPKLLYEINYGPHKLFKSSIIKKHNIKFPEDLKYEDVLFVAEFLKYADKVGQIKEPLYIYIIHENSETTIRDDRVFDILKILKIHKELYNEKRYYEKSMNLYVKILTNYTIQQRYQKNVKTIVRFINEAFDFLNQLGDWKKCEYLKNRSFLKKVIEKSKSLSIIYCIITSKVWYNCSCKKGK